VSSKPVANVDHGVLQDAVAGHGSDYIAARRLIEDEFSLVGIELVSHQVIGLDRPPDAVYSMSQLVSPLRVWRIWLRN